MVSTLSTPRPGFDAQPNPKEPPPKKDSFKKEGATVHAPDWLRKLEARTCNIGFDNLEVINDTYKGSFCQEVEKKLPLEWVNWGGESETESVNKCFKSLIVN